MYVIRPVRETDLENVYALVSKASEGIVSLPKDRGKIENKISHSIASFQKEVQIPEKELYLFILENVESGELCGISGIHSRSGEVEPLYVYGTEEEKREGPNTPNQTLLLPKRIEEGPSELCSLFMRPAHRRSGMGVLLSLSRLLFIASFPQRFTGRVIARLRGYVRNDSSVFWESLGRRFFDMEFRKAVSLQAESPEQVEKILPKHPVYLSLLAGQAQKVVGKVHPNTRPALKLLKKEGFSLTPDVDVFDAGPVVAAETDLIKAVRNSYLETVNELHPFPLGVNQRIISNDHLDFRACMGTLKKTADHKVVIHEEAARLINIEAGDRIRYTAAHKRKEK